MEGWLADLRVFQISDKGRRSALVITTPYKDSIGFVAECGKEKQSENLYYLWSAEGGHPHSKNPNSYEGEA